MDISSEFVHSLLPIFMTTILGTSIITIGIIEGVAEAAAAITKVFSGVISDYCRKRKWLAVVGYTLSAITKPIFPLAATTGWVFGARFVDRIGKGIRGAPRDALVADIAPQRLRGAAYGLRQSLDSVGAFVGPLLAVMFMIWFANDIKSVLWVAVAPAFIAVFLLMTAVHEPNYPEHPANRKDHLALTDIKRLPLRYWLVVLLGAVFTLARFSEAFLILRAPGCRTCHWLRARDHDRDEHCLRIVCVPGRSGGRSIIGANAPYIRTHDTRSPPISCWRLLSYPGSHFSGLHSGDCIWRLPRDCYRSSLPIHPRWISAARPSGYSIYSME